MAKITANAAACFDDFFVEKHPHLPILRLLAEFCGNGTRPKVELKMVQAWQRDEYKPGGELQIYIRCFLTLAGYEVTEIKQLEGCVQKLAMISSLGLVSMEEIARRIWPTSDGALKNLLRVLMGGGGFTNAARTEAEAIVAQNKRAMESKARAWRERIRELVGPSPSQSQVSPPALDDHMPVIATAFGRSVATCIALGKVLSESGRIQDVRSVTGGGQTIHELLELLEKLSGKKG